MNDPPRTIEPDDAAAFFDGALASAATQAAEAPASPLASVGIQQFLATRFREPDWIVDGLLERGDKGNLIAPSKTYKTWFALGLALHVAAGRTYLGHYRATTPRRVLYCNLEVKAEWMQRRLLLTERFYHRIFTRDDCAETFRIANLRGHGGDLRKAIDARDKAAFLHTFALPWEPDLVVVDPRYKLLKEGEDENSMKDLKGLLDAIDSLAGFGWAVLTVSHDGKSDIAFRSIQNRGAGSYAAAADDDARIALARHETDEAGIVVDGISRNASTGPSFCVKWTDLGEEGLGFVVADELEAKKKSEEQPPARRGRKPEISGELVRETASQLLGDAALAGLSAGGLEQQLSDATHAAPRTVRNYLKAMLDSGEIVQRGNTRTARYFLPMFYPQNKGGNNGN